MDVWLAGLPGAPEQTEYKLDDKKRLYSLFEMLPFPNGGRLQRCWKEKLIRMEKSKKKVDLFLDSGAFSAWTQGAYINIKEYIKFIKENEDVLQVYANLDVIKVRDAEDKKWIGPNEASAAATWKNQKIMEKAGLNPLPCFHFGEPWEYLERYVAEYPYLALGVAGNSGTTLMPWLDDCFKNHICDKEGMPKIKIHGFAVTSLKVMMRYPFYSVDSTSWVVTGRMGSIFVPRYRAGQWIYDENSWKIAVSSKSPSNKEAGKHITTLHPVEKEIFLDYIHHKGYVLGKSHFKKVPQTHELAENEKWSEKKPADKSAKREIEVIDEIGISNQYQLRDELNIIYFLDLEKSLPAWPWAFKIKGNTSLF